MLFGDGDEMDEEDIEEEFVVMMMESGYALEPGNWSMVWTLDGLEENLSYSLVWSAESPGDTTFFCGDGPVIPHVTIMLRI